MAEKNWFEHYRKNKNYFWGWLLSLLGLGLLGFWVPVGYYFVREQPIPMGNIVIAGDMSTFSIVVLIEAILSGVSIPKKGRPSHFLLISTVIIAVAQVCLYIFVITGTTTTTIKWFILLLTLIAVILSIIYYQYRQIDAEEGADTVVDEENRQVESQASSTTSNSNPLP